MKIKSYRAETLRAALMQIKEELGEDALVLETKKVRGGGLFGVGARDLIEVRVAPSPDFEERQQAGHKSKAPKKATEGKQQLRERLDLTDDSSAMPKPARETGQKNTRFDFTASKEFAEEHGFHIDEESLRAFAALASRAATDEPEPPRRKDSGALNGKRPYNYSVPGNSSSRIEIAETAPRIVHPKNAARAKYDTGSLRPPVAPHIQPQLQNDFMGGNAQSFRAPKPPTPPPFPSISAKGPANFSEPAGNNAERQAVDAELARLRAELREMKMALGAFASRPVMNPLGDDRNAEFRDSAAGEAMFVQGAEYSMFQELRGSGLPKQYAQQAVKQARGLGESTDLTTRTRMALTAALPSWMTFADSAMPLQEAIAFVGATGVGKTTTIAKLAAHVALRAKQRVELVTLDTFRIAAVQQLKTYAEIIGAGCHVAHSVQELDSVVRRFAGVATVMIDTTGRSPHDLADQFDLADYLRQRPQVIKCMVLAATNHPEDARLALDKFSMYGANRLALTKLDETVQPGATVAVAASSSLPLMYLCAGQRVPEDLERATPATLAQRILRPRVLAQAA